MIIKKSKKEPRIRKKITLDDRYLRQKFLRKFLRKYGSTPFPRTHGKKYNPEEQKKLQEKELDIKYDENAVYEVMFMRRLYEIILHSKPYTTNFDFYEGQQNYIRMFRAMDKIENLFVKHLLKHSRLCIRSVLEKILEEIDGIQNFFNVKIFNYLKDKSKAPKSEQVSTYFNGLYFTDQGELETAENKSFQQFKKYVFNCCFNSLKQGQYVNLDLLTDAVIMLLMEASYNKEEYVSFDKLQSKPLENLGVENCYSLVNICECWDKKYFIYQPGKADRITSYRKFIGVFKLPRNDVKHNFLVWDRYGEFLKMLEQSLYSNSETQCGWEGFHHEQIHEILDLLCDSYPEDTYNDQLRGLQFIIPDYLNEHYKDEDRRLLPKEHLLSVNKLPNNFFDKFKSSFNTRFDRRSGNKPWVKQRMEALMSDFPVLLNYYVSGLAQAFKFFSSTNGALLSADQDKARDNADRMKMNLIHQVLTETTLEGTEEKLINFMEKKFDNEKKIQLVIRNPNSKNHNNNLDRPNRPLQIVHGLQGRAREYALKGGNRDDAEHYLYMYLSLIDQINTEAEAVLGWKGPPMTAAMKKELKNIGKTAESIWESKDVHLNSFLLHFNLDGLHLKEAIDELQLIVNPVRSSVVDYSRPIQSDSVDDEILKVFLKLGLRSAYSIIHKRKKFSKVQQNKFCQFPLPRWWLHKFTPPININLLPNYFDKRLENFHKRYDHIYLSYGNPPFDLLPPLQRPPNVNSLPRFNLRHQFQVRPFPFQQQHPFFPYQQQHPFFPYQQQHPVSPFQQRPPVSPFQQQHPRFQPNNNRSARPRVTAPPRNQSRKLPSRDKDTTGKNLDPRQGRNSRKRKMPSSSENDSRVKKVCYQLDKKIQKYERRIRKLDQIISDIENNH